MKTIILKFSCILFCILSVQTGLCQGNGSQKLIDREDFKSFKNYFESFDWTNYEEVEPKKSFSCKFDGIPKLNRMRNPMRDVGVREYVSAVINLLGFIETVKSEVKGDYFDKVKEKEGSFFDTPTFKRDKMIEKLQTANSSEQFVDFYGTKLDQSKVKFTDSERKRLIYIYEKTRDYFKNPFEGSVAYDQYVIGDCEYTVKLYAWPTKIEATRVVWEFQTRVFLNCDCLSVSSSYKLKHLSTHFKTQITSTWTNYDYDSMRWGSAEKSKMEITRWKCCDNSEGKPLEIEGFNDPIPNNGGDKEEEKDQKEKDKLKREKKCCNEVPANNSVGLFPTINFGNNLDDSTLGIGVEYLHRGGVSLANNNWYFGVGGQISASSGQGGELKENFYSGAVIVENRTPILPCVQWTQRLSGEYGQGTLEAFGNKDDFTHFLVGLNTGANFDLGGSFSLAIDARLFEIGSQTFKPANGPEIKTDIKNLSIPPTKVRFGFRFKF